METHTPTWQINALISLRAAVVVAPLSQAMGLSPIMGYLAQEWLLAPVLGLVTNVEDTLHYAEFGVF